jgi:hypothetical protein
MAVGAACDAASVNVYVETPTGPTQQPSHIEASVFAFEYMCSYDVARPENRSTVSVASDAGWGIRIHLSHTSVVTHVRMP